MNMFHVGESGPVVMAVLVILAAMSVASWYMIFWKAWSLHGERKSLALFRKKYATTADWPKHVLPGLVNGSVDLVTREAEKVKPIIASYAQEERRTILSMHLVQALDVARLRCDRGVTLLASVGSTSPFIGLFGTVWGITGALAKISAEGNAGLSVVAGPMGEALIATAIGLFAAIPAVLAYNMFVRLSRVHVQELRHIAEQMTVYIPLKIPAAPRHASDAIQLVRD